VLDSIADPKSIAHIDFHLRLWLNHQANQPPDAALNLDTISAHVRSCSPITFLAHFIYFQVPQQPNGYDCGIYVVHFAKTFFSDADIYTTHILVIKILCPSHHFHTLIVFFQGQIK
jgi:hypothetical protein